MVFARFGRRHARTLLAIAAAVLWVPSTGVAAPGKIAVAAFALWRGQGVFPSEAGQAARLAGGRGGCSSCRPAMRGSSPGLPIPTRW